MTNNGYEPFKTAQEVADKDYHLHSVTGDEYIFDEEKGSWRVMSAVKNRVFHQPTAPDIPSNGQQLDGYLPRQGDMWWDTTLMELRVWHEPEPEDPLDKKQPGRWISSTNPHMSPLTPKKNRVIGKLTLLDENDNPFRYKEVYEDTLYRVRVERTDSTAEESLIAYSWKAVPPEIDGFPVEISHPTAAATSVIIPPLRRDANGDISGDLRAVRIQCDVRAIDKIDTFIEPFKSINTGSMPIKEIPISNQIETGNVDVRVLSDSDIGGDDATPKYLVYTIDSNALSGVTDYSNPEGWPPGKETYHIQAANISLTQQTTVMDFIYARDNVKEDYYLAFYEDPARTVLWGTTGVGADLGVMDQDQRNHRIIVDKDFFGNIYFSKFPAGSEPTMAGHIEWGQLPPPEGDIGVVSISGTSDPKKNVETTYTINYTGSVEENRVVKTLTTSDPLAKVNGDKVTFGTEGYQTVNAVVKSIYASDSPQTATIGVDVEPGLDKIGNFKISGDDRAIVGVPNVYTYSYDGDVVNHTVEFTTGDSTATVTGGSIVFGQPGDFAVRGRITADDSVEGYADDTIMVNVLSGISSHIEMAKDEVDTGKPETYLMVVDGVLNNKTHTWTTTRSDGGTKVRSYPDGVITHFTSGREFYEELVDGDISGDSYVLLDYATSVDDGLFITFPEVDTRTSIGLYMSTFLDGTPDDSEQIPITINALREDGSLGASVSVSISSLTPELYTMNLPFVDEKISGLRLISKAAGSRVAVHGYVVDGYLVESYINDTIVDNGESAIITMYKFDEDRTVQCIADGDEGRSVARFSVPVIDPPEPTLGSSSFKAPNRYPVSGETEYTYEFETKNNTVDVSYSASFVPTNTNIPNGLGYELDDSEVANGILKLKFPYFYADDLGWIANIEMKGNLVVIVEDARNDIDESERLPSSTASVSNIAVQYPFTMVPTTSVQSGQDFPADTNISVGWIGAMGPELDALSLELTASMMTATDEDGNVFTADSMANVDPDGKANREFTFDGLAAGTYVFASDVTYLDGAGATGDVTFRFTKSVS